MSANISIRTFIVPMQMLNASKIVTFFFEDSTRKILDSDVKEACEGILTKAECKQQAAKNMEPDKTPGTDGLPADFYKVFWNDIADYLVNSVNYASGKGQLLVTQRRGIIKLIPKKDAEPDLIKNWRPVTLLNCDYKMAAKAIANRRGWSALGCG